MPRAIWTGAISFGLVNIPVRMYSAIDTTDLEFSLLHAKDGGHIGYQKVCKREDKPVPDDEIDPGSVRVGKDELAMAADLIDRFAGTWKPDRYRDTYRERLLKVIEAKGKGKEIQVDEVPERKPPDDLLEALRASVDAAKSKRKRPARTRSRPSSGTRKRKRAPAQR